MGEIRRSYKIVVYTGHPVKQYTGLVSPAMTHRGRILRAPKGEKANRMPAGFDTGQEDAESLPLWANDRDT